MRLVTFREGSTARLGARAGDQIIDLAAADSAIPSDMRSFLESGDGARSAAEKAVGSGRPGMPPRLKPTSGKHLPR